MPTQITPEELGTIGFPHPDVAAVGGAIYRAEDCEACRGSGYQGRLAIYEICLVTPALQHLINSGAHPVELLRQAIQDGMSLSRALPATSPSFGNLYCALAAAGEASGALPTILKRQAQYLRSFQELRSKVLFALIYPAFLRTRMDGVIEAVAEGTSLSRAMDRSGICFGTRWPGGRGSDKGPGHSSLPRNEAW